LSSLGNYFHTLRHLRAVQVFGRIRFKLYRPPADERPAPSLRERSNPYVTPIGAGQSMLGFDRFRFLNLEGTCALPEQWHGRGHSPLWTYNLHYFDDLNAAENSARRPWHERIMERWIDENRPGMGIGWDPYPVSRRTVNWVKWSLRGNVLSAQARQSLAVQARWLRGRIETHLQGNHVFANAKALVFAGLYFSGEEAEGWLRQGLALADTEIAEQVLADGGHFERSTMYHAAFVEDLLDMIGVMQAHGYTAARAWHEAAARMLSWLEAMSHPDAGIAFFNDAAFGMAPTFMQLREYAAHLNVGFEPRGTAGLRRLMPSGYISIDLPPFFLICDVAPIGPDHLSGHGHADTLSFELSFKGRRVFVNSGTSEYGLGAERQRQRGTAAHCTLVIDGRDSSEVWGGFRVARRARARLLEARAANSSATIAGEHDGYRRLPGRNVHRRSWALSAQGLAIEDTVDGTFGSADCYFHLHPDIRVLEIGDFELRLSDSRESLLEMRFDGAARVEVAESTWHPEFGLTMANRCIVARLSGAGLKTVIRAC
jgi:uncharacterized heparinase superfamily protein